MNQRWLGVLYDECHDVVSCPSFMQNVILKRYCFFEVMIVDDDDDSFGDFNLIIWWWPLVNYDLLNCMDVNAW